MNWNGWNQDLEDICECDICSSGFDCGGGVISIDELNEWYEQDETKN